MPPKLFLTALVLSLIGFSSTATRAQMTLDVAKMSCEQFAHSKIAPLRIAAAWLSGYYHGKRNNPVIEMQTLEANADKLEIYCGQEKNYKVPVMQAIEQLFGSGK